MKSGRIFGCLAVLLFFACSANTPGGSTPPQALSLGMGTSATDDPWLIQAQDGYYYLAFISNQSGGNELYLPWERN